VKKIGNISYKFNMRRKEKSVGEVLGTAFISFIVTNIDDLVVLMNFFTQATILNSSLKARHVFIGQYLGFIILLGFSLIGYGVSYAIPVQMLGFLGFFPIILGIKGIIEIIIEQYKKCNLNVNDIVPNDQISTIELETIRYRNDIDGEIIFEFTIQQEQENAIVDPPSPIECKQKILKLLSHCINLQTLKIASITLANSGDNVAIYTPLFAQASEWQIAVYIGIFLGMVFVWLVFCYFFINFRPILSIAQKYAHYFVPIVFIGIGIYIIITSDCFPWLARAIQTKNFKNG
jgi:cadmium resistance protein CadD (predicted permease)